MLRVLGLARAQHIFFLPLPQKLNRSKKHHQNVESWRMGWWECCQWYWDIWLCSNPPTEGWEGAANLGLCWPGSPCWDIDFQTLDLPGFVITEMTVFVLVLKSPWTARSKIVFDFLKRKTSLCLCFVCLVGFFNGAQGVHNNIPSFEIELLFIFHFENF